LGRKFPGVRNARWRRRASVAAGRLNSSRHSGGRPWIPLLGRRRDTCAPAPGSGAGAVKKVVAGRSAVSTSGLLLVGQCVVTCAAHCSLHTAHCTLHTAHCTLHNVHCTLHTAHCPLFTAHCTMVGWHCVWTGGCCASGGAGRSAAQLGIVAKPFITGVALTHPLKSQLVAGCTAPHSVHWSQCSVHCHAGSSRRSLGICPGGRRPPGLGNLVGAWRRWTALLADICLKVPAWFPGCKEGKCILRVTAATALHSSDRSAAGTNECQPWHNTGRWGPRLLSKAAPTVLPGSPDCTVSAVWLHDTSRPCTAVTAGGAWAGRCAHCSALECAQDNYAVLAVQCKALHGSPCQVMHCTTIAVCGNAHCALLPATYQWGRRSDWLGVAPRAPRSPGPGYGWNPLARDTAVMKCTSRGYCHIGDTGKQPLTAPSLGTADGGRRTTHRQAGGRQPGEQSI
jgi:hypothetical protein